MSFSSSLDRKFRVSLIAVTLALLACCWLASSAQATLNPKCLPSNGVVTCTYNFTGGEQRFVTPAGITEVSVTAVGAPGASTTTAAGGAGASVRADLFVNPGQTVYVEVGGPGRKPAGGFNGGGTGGVGGGGGGGATDVQVCSRTATSCSASVPGFDSRWLVAAGGGGAGENGASGGDASSSPQSGASGPSTFGIPPGGGGGAASQEAPGSGGAAGIYAGAINGATGNGGNGASGGAGVSTCTAITGPSKCFAGSGGGGGGLYGGGSGGSGAFFGTISEPGGGGGAGSSSYQEDVDDANVSGTPATGQPPQVTISFVQSTPAVSSVVPATLGQGAAAVPMTISGSDFVAPATVKFVGPSTGVTASVRATTATTVSVAPSVASTATPGQYDIVVTNPDGGVATCHGCLTVVAGPKIKSISPSTLAPGSTTTLTVTGTGFSSDAQLSGPPGVKVSRPRVSSDGTSMTATATVSPTVSAGTSLPVLVREGFAGGYGSTTFAGLTIS